MLRINAADYQYVPGALTATGNSVPFVLPFTDITALTVKMAVSAASGTTPTLDVYLQNMGPDGNWYDMIHFAQQTAVTAGGSAIWGSTTCDDGARYIGVVGSGTIASGSVGVPILTNQFRFKNNIGGTTPSFTYTADVYAVNADRAGV